MVDPNTILSRLEMVRQTGTEHLLDDARLAILAMNLRAALARLEKVKEGWQ